MLLLPLLGRIVLLLLCDNLLVYGMIDFFHFQFATYSLNLQRIII